MSECSTTIYSEVEVQLDYGFTPGAKPVRDDIWGGDPGYDPECEIKEFFVRFQSRQGDNAIAFSDLTPEARARLKEWFERENFDDMVSEAA